MRLSILTKLAVLFVLLWVTPTSSAPLSLALTDENPLGRYTSFMKETAGRLDIGAVLAVQKSGIWTSASSPVLTFGIGANPVWIHLPVDNPTQTPLHKQLSIETAWLDHVEVYFVQGGKTVASYRTGDAQVFSQRPLKNRFFIFDHNFNPGVSDIFIRVATHDPMVVPIYLMSPEQMHAREVKQEYSYGIVYGFLFALLAYNAILYLSLRSSRLLFYALYLALFILMNIAYTGHGFEWLWPNSVALQRWAPPILIFLYGSSGVLFAIRFLDLRAHFPRVYRAVVGYCLGVGVLLATAALAGSQHYALLISFSFAFSFSIIMLLLGAVSVYSGFKLARYFLLAAIAVIVGATLTTLSSWGFIPFTIWTFRAVEIGMLFDATLLALALAYQFHLLQEAKIRAERLAQLDPLTGLNNRRAFYDKAEPLWSTGLRKGRHASIILIDIDMFKQINDTHGHAHGDAALIAIATTLLKLIRQGDVLARWGGEEFVAFLPETNIEEAIALAERLRAAIASTPTQHASATTNLTASFGVASKEAHHLTLDALISDADRYLYQSKQQGRNRVGYSPAGHDPALEAV